MESSEKKLQKKILQFLKQEGVYVRKTIVVNKNGSPDIVGCYKSKYFAFECKGLGQKPTALQLYNLKEIKEAGGAASWGDKFEDFMELWVQLANN